MIPRDDVLDESVPSSSAGGGTRGRVLPFRQRASEEADLYGNAGISYETVYDSRRKAERPPERSLASEAVLLIDTAADSDYSKVERSNSFDSWKTSLRALAKTSLSRNTYYRQILGSMILATNKKDLVDFSLEGLRVFREATVVIGTPGTSELDSKHVISILKKADLLRPLPTYSEEDVSLLDEQIEHWLSRRRNNA